MGAISNSYRQSHFASSTVALLVALPLICLTPAANAAKPAARATMLSAQACRLEPLQASVARFSGEQATTLDAAVWFAGGSTDNGKPVGLSNPVLPAHCVVTGVIGAHAGDPVTATGPTQYGNHFRLRIPQYWNGRFFFQGGGGNNGSVGNAIGMLKDGQNALSQGYVVVAQDSGHVGRDAAFSLDRKAYTDFAYQAVHDATLISKAIVKTYAKRAPDYSYFVGCSNGGREAMVSAQRYADFDGVVAGDPGFAVNDQWVQNLAMLQIVSKVSGTPAGMVPTDTSKAYNDDQLAYVSGHFMDKCDRLDGLIDGLMSNYQACKPTAADYKTLLCKKDGGDSDNAHCLNATQIDGLERIYSGIFDHNSKLVFPGFLPGSIESSLRETYLGTSGSPFPLSSLYNSIMPNLYFMGYGFQAYPGVTGPANKLSSYPAFSLEYVTRFDVESEPAKFAQGRLDFHGANIDPHQPGPNFEAFRKRGGKMLIYTGTADPAVQATGIMAFMDRFNAYYKSEIAAQTARLFMIPGMNHCRGGTTADQFDQLAPLVAWVEQGIAPERIVSRALPDSALDQKMPGINRPLCAYPKYAKYNGNGNPASADSFICTVD